MSGRRADDQPGNTNRGELARAIPPAPLAYEPPAIDAVLAPYGPTEPKPPARALTLERLLRFKWTFLAVFVGVAVPAIAGIWLFSVPKYTAKAEVRVRPIIPRLVFTTEDNGMIPLYQSYMNTQVSIMRSPVVLGRTLDQPDVRKTEWYNQPESSFLGLGPAVTPLERLRKDLTVGPRQQTELIDVSLTALKPEEAAAIVNAVLEQYTKYTREQADETSDQLYRKLTEELDSLRSEIEGREKVVAKLSQELGTSTPDQLVSQKRLRLDEAETKLETVRQDLATATWQERELTARLQPPAPAASSAAPAISAVAASSALTATSAVTAASAVPAETVAPAMPSYESDDLWRQLNHDLTLIKSRVALESRKITPTHPRQIELRQLVEEAEKSRHDRELELDKLWKTHPEMAARNRSAVPLPTLTSIAAIGQVREEVDLWKELETVRRQVKLLKYQEQLRMDEVKTQRAEFDQVFSSAQLLEKESEAIKHKRGLYEAVRTRVDQKEMERNVPGSIEVLTKAVAPSEPSNDRRLILSILAFVGGLGAGVGACFLRLSTTQTIHDADDLGQATAAPFLGQLPFVAQERGKAKVVVENDEHLLEAMRMLRTALLQRIDYQQGSIVQVTSAEPGVGKSTVSALLARSLAQCGKKVLLVDADLRNSNFAQRFGVPAEPGLIGVLTGSSDADSILGTDLPLLSILPAGRATRDSDAELVANGVLGVCLTRWQANYDLVLLDSPPLLPVADARILAQKAHGSIMVVRGRQSQRASVFEALSYLQIAGGKLLGVVFIGSSGSGGYGYPSYSYKFSYGKPKGEAVQTEDVHGT